VHIGHAGIGLIDILQRVVHGGRQGSERRVHRIVRQLLMEKNEESAHGGHRNHNHNCDDIEQVRSRKILIVLFHLKLIPGFWFSTPGAR
jgi:hypothetical protein